MRRFLSIPVLSLSLALGGCAEHNAPGSAPDLAAEGATQETAASIVQKHVTAAGGRERLLAAKTMKFSAKNEKAGAEADSFTVVRARPNMFRKEVTKAGVTTVKAFDGKAGWTQEAGKATALDEEHCAKMSAHADFDDAMIDYEKKGHKVELLGKEDVRGASAYKLKLTLASGGVETRYLDTKSMLEVKRVGEYVKDGKTETWATYFTDYKPVSGIPVNHGIETEKNGEVTRYVLTDVSYDQPVDAATFRLPAPGT